MSALEAVRPTDRPMDHSSDPPESTASNGSAPLVAVPADIRELDGYRWHAVPSQYLEAARDAAGVTPVIVPAHGEASLPPILDAVDGLLVSGSRTNVHPSLYGETPSPAFEPYDDARDGTSLPLIRHAIERGLPVLAICRGIQELNVALGGTLATEIQERKDRDDHRMTPSDEADVRFAIKHDLAIAPDGVLAGILGAGTRVNSLHRQAIERTAPGLRVEATAPDGTIEAVSVRGARGFALGVQWHPEYWARRSASSRDYASWTLFAAFGEAVRSHAASRSRTTRDATTHAGMERTAS